MTFSQVVLMIATVIGGSTAFVGVLAWLLSQWLTPGGPHAIHPKGSKVYERQKFIMLTAFGYDPRPPGSNGRPLDDD